MRIIGVDTDLYDSNVDDAPVYLTSVLKHFDEAMNVAVERIVVDGESGGAYLGTIENSRRTQTGHRSDHRRDHRRRHPGHLIR